MKTIIVTGANRGIGLEICRQLDGLGHQVILCSRDIEKGKNAALSLSPNVHVKQLDVTDMESIRSLYHDLKSSFKSIDVLINNAGIGEVAYLNKSFFLLDIKNKIEINIPLVRHIKKKIMPFLRRARVVPQKEGAASISIETVKHIMDTNFYGPWRTTQVFLPLLEKSTNARIINISSGMGALGALSGSHPGYSLSKTALNALTIMLSNEFKAKKISVNAMCPGWVNTDMGGYNAPKTIADGADTAVWLATKTDSQTGKFYKDRTEISF